MEILIPTYRRVNRQLTLNALPKKWRNRTTLVVDAIDAREFDKINHDVEIMVAPKSIKTIAQKRAWILRQWHGRILMLDDDLRFAARMPGTTKLKQADDAAVDAALSAVASKLTKVAHVGISARQGHNRLPDVTWAVNTRTMYALGYDCDVVQKTCELGRIETREDMELALQLLTRGMPNALYVPVCVDQYGYNASGGVSEQRSVLSSNEDAEKLAKLFPGLVKVVEKKYTSSIPRKEVICYWKKAFEQGTGK